MHPKKPTQLNPIKWNTDIASLPGAHILQSWEWGKVKSQFGWQPHYLCWLQEQGQIELIINRHLDDHRINRLVAAALVLHRKLMMGGFSHRMGVIYVPKGPLLDWSEAPLRHQVLKDLKGFAQKHSAIFIKIDPDLELGTGIPDKPGANEHHLGADVINDLQTDGWQFSEEQIQFRNTVIVNLEQREEDLLANMKQKTRYNVNLAMRKGG